tara:strand:+ start:2734 stop:3468 length:735 start_codon:yes stop_codon:yes gene_type:complete
VKKLNINKLSNIILRLNIFTFSYLLYLIQLIFIFFKLKNEAKNVFNAATYFCSLSFGINYDIDENLKKRYLKKGIHISNHDNPLDIFVAQHFFKIKTITTVDKHLKNFLPFFEVSLKNYGHYCFDHLNFNDRKSAYLYLDRICKKDKYVLIYPSGSIYTSIIKRLSKSVSKLSMINNLKVIAWKFIFDDEAKIEYDRNIGQYILKRICSDKLVLQIEKVKVFNPKDYTSFEDLHLELCLFYSDS